METPPDAAVSGGPPPTPDATPDGGTSDGPTVVNLVPWWFEHLAQVEPDLAANAPAADGRADTVVDGPGELDIDDGWEELADDELLFDEPLFAEPAVPERAEPRFRIQRVGEPAPPPRPSPASGGEGHAHAAHSAASWGDASAAPGLAPGHDSERPADATEPFEPVDMEIIPEVVDPDDQPSLLAHAPPPGPRPAAAAPPPWILHRMHSRPQTTNAEAAAPKAAGRAPLSGVMIAFLLVVGMFLGIVATCLLVLVMRDATETPAAAEHKPAATARAAAAPSDRTDARRDSRPPPRRPAPPRGRTAGAGNTRPLPPAITRRADLPQQPDASGVGSVLRSARAYARKCAENHDFNADTSILFQITPGGEARDIQVADGDPEFKACVRRAFAIRKFPRSLEGRPVRLRLPFSR